MSRPDRRTIAPRARMPLPVLIAVALILATIIINPFREMCMWDDSFAYARVVQHLLSTGHYQRDSWAAQNMLVQAYLAAGLSKIFGYSLSLLRCTTLCLFAVGIASFYRLLRDLGYSEDLAAVLTLAIPATPLVLMLAFTFMSDVQFVSWMLLALFLYARGIHNRSIPYMLLGSLAAACAIGTRQFGIAILFGLAATWFWPLRHRPPASLLFAGIVVPLLAAIGLIHGGLSTPNFIQTALLSQVRVYAAEPASLLLKDFIWRGAVLAQYAGISLLVLLPFTLGLPRTFWTSRILRIPLWLLAVLACIFVIIGLAMPTPSARPEARQYGLRTPLEMYWLLPTQLWPIPRVMWFLDIGGIVGGAILLVLCLLALRTLAHARPEKVLLTGTALGLMFLHVVYSQFSDTYIVALIPFALLIVGEALHSFPQPRFLMRVCAATAMVFILVTALWMRGEYAAQEAIWNSADELLRSGVQPLDVSAPCWSEYHGSFDAWIAAGVPGYDISNSHGYTDPVHDPYHLWRQAEWDRAHYHVVTSSKASAPPGWRLIAARSYRTARLSRSYVLLLERVPAPSLSQQGVAKVR